MNLSCKDWIEGANAGSHSVRVENKVLSHKLFCFQDAGAQVMAVSVNMNCLPLTVFVAALPNLMRAILMLLAGQELHMPPATHLAPSAKQTAGSQSKPDL